MKAKSIDAVKLLRAYQDLLRKQIVALLDVPAQRLEQAKHAFHDAKIESNRLQKEIDEVENAITLELKLALQEEQQVTNDWEVKSHSQLLELIEDK